MTNVIELRCPACRAPIDPARAAVGACRYCGATLVIDQPKATRVEPRYFLSVRAAPSNRERAARVVRESGVDGAEADAVMQRSPAEVEVGRDEGRAYHLARALIEAGAEAEVIERQVEVKEFNVILDEVGNNKLAVIVALREQIPSIGVAEAKRFIDRVPCVVMAGVVEAPAKQFLQALVAAGAKAHLD